jgi:hypothetical protein
MHACTKSASIHIGYGVTIGSPTRDLGWILINRFLFIFLEGGPMESAPAGTFGYTRFSFLSRNPMVQDEHCVEMHIVNTDRQEGRKDSSRLDSSIARCR